MTNRKKKILNKNPTIEKSQKDDDNCSVICYKDPNDNQIGIVRIRQQVTCSACNIIRPTILSYYKHLFESNHCQNVKKLCEENQYKPSIYDQVIHLAFSNNLYYQSPKFHFLYKHADEETTKEKIIPSNGEIQRNFEITLVFQEKTYAKIGLANGQTREDLFKDLITDRTEEIAALPEEIYYRHKKITSDFDADSFMLLPSVQQQDESKLSTEITDNMDEKNDDLICKSMMESIVRDVYSKSAEFRREKQFFTGIIPRNCRKKNTLYCDICEKLISSSEDNCINHFNQIEHLNKLHHYQTEFLPWRRAMQQSLITGQSVKEIMGNSNYDEFMQTMAFYLAPNNLSSRGRFCCGFCELVFTEQWTLEKHLHSNEHKEKQTSTDHKELVINFANRIILPVIYKYNGIQNVTELPESLRTRYQNRTVTRAQYEDDVKSFLRSYPFDTFESVWQVKSNRSERRRRAQPNHIKHSFKAQSNNNINNNINNNNKQIRNTRSFQTPNGQRGALMKRPYPQTAPPNKRFRSDLNTSYPGANRGPGLLQNYPGELQPTSNYSRPNSYNNNWPSRYPNDQQRQDFFERSSFPSQPVVNNNSNGFYSSTSSHPMSSNNNYNPNRQTGYNDMNSRTYNPPQINYDSNYPRPMSQNPSEYHRQDHRTNPRPFNDHSPYVNNNNNHNFSQQTSPPRSSLLPMNQTHYQNSNSYGVFSSNPTSNNTNPSFFQSPVNQHTNNSSIHSYADYRASSALPTSNSYPSSSLIPQTRTFDEFGLSSLASNSSNSYNRSTGSTFNHDEQHYGNFNQQNQFEQSNQTSWHRGTRGSGHLNTHRGQRGRGAGPNAFSTAKQPGATFSYSSSSNNNNNFSTRGRGAASRNFGNRQ